MGLLDKAVKHFRQIYLQHQALESPGSVNAVKAEVQLRAVLLAVSVDCG
jgi:hypothetical protein